MTRDRRWYTQLPGFKRKQECILSGSSIVSAVLREDDTKALWNVVVFMQDSSHTSPPPLFRCQCLCFLKEAHGTKHQIYSLCVFLIIGSEVTQLFESFRRTPKTGRGAAPSAQAFVQRDQRSWLLRDLLNSSPGHEDIPLVRMFGILGCEMHCESVA